MNEQEREKWLKGLKARCEQLADKLKSLESQKEVDPEEWAIVFNEFLDKIRLYEEASKKHEKLKRENS